jgi:hypothetical protein
VKAKIELELGDTQSAEEDAAKAAKSTGPSSPGILSGAQNLTRSIRARTPLAQLFDSCR